jgi:hypothetical protein
MASSETTLLFEIRYSSGPPIGATGVIRVPKIDI